MILKPIVSEKAIVFADKQNTYAFYVPKSANKLEVAKQVASKFDVTVTNVRTALLKGKSKRTQVRRGRNLIDGKRSDRKKAYVTLKAGDTITLFEGSE